MKNLNEQHILYLKEFVYTHIPKGITSIFETASFVYSKNHNVLSTYLYTENIIFDLYSCEISIRDTKYPDYKLLIYPRNVLSEEEYFQLSTTNNGLYVNFEQYQCLISCFNKIHEYHNKTN